MSFANKVILITGASSGIGADAAVHLAKQGASVAIVGRNADRLNGVAQQVRETGSQVLPIVADVSVDAARIINETIDRFGRLDVLVNNAGILEFSAETLGTLDVYDRVMATNVRAVLELTKLAVPHLEKTKGNVVNVSSIAAYEIVVGAVAYAMSKAAVDHFTRCAAIELGKKSIRVNSVNPGAIVTGLFERNGMDAAAMERFAEECKTTYPVGRIGQVTDTSNAIAFLANEAASFITGHILIVDGGKHHNAVFLNKK